MKLQLHWLHKVPTFTIRRLWNPLSVMYTPCHRMNYVAPHKGPTKRAYHYKTPPLIRLAPRPSPLAHITLTQNSYRKYKVRKLPEAIPSLPDAMRFAEDENKKKSNSCQSDATQDAKREHTWWLRTQVYNAPLRNSPCVRVKKKKKKKKEPARPDIFPCARSLESLRKPCAAQHRERKSASSSRKLPAFRRIFTSSLIFNYCRCARRMRALQPR